MKKKLKVTGALLISLIIMQATTVFAADFATYSKSGYYFSGYNNASNPWYGNPYADLNTTYKGNDSSHTGLYGTQYVGTSVGNTTSLSSQGTVRLNANVFFSGLVTFKSTHFVKVDGTYQRQYLTTNP